MPGFSSNPYFYTDLDRSSLHKFNAQEKAQHPFDLIAIVFLPNHIHSIWELPENDDEWPKTLDELNELVKTNIETFTHKYDSEGNLIFEISEGGYAVELDQSDGSAWIADKTNIWHYSANSRHLASYTGSSDCQRWLAIVPCTKPNKIAGY